MIQRNFDISESYTTPFQLALGVDAQGTGIQKTKGWKKFKSKRITTFDMRLCHLGIFKATPSNSQKHN